MLKNILELRGVQTLNKESQRSVKGGVRLCHPSICAIWDTLVLMPACTCDV